MKKFLAILIGSVMALSVAAPSFAATGARTSSSKNVTTVTEKGATVNKVVNVYNEVRYENNASYNGYGYTTLFGNYYHPSFGNMYHYLSDLTNAGWIVDRTYTSAWVVADVHRTVFVGSSTSTVFVIDSVSYDTEVSYVYEDGELKQVTNTVERVKGHDEVTTTNVSNNESATVMYDPLILDIKGNNKISVANNEWLPHAPKFYQQFVSKFDFTGDGVARTCEWVSDNPDAFLVMPEKGRVDSVLQLFGNLGGYANGFDKLSTLCDTDKNGWVEGEELSGLALWIDANRDGICQPSELHSLQSFGVSRISTSEKNFAGSYQTTDGQTRTMWAWWPSVK